MNDDDILSYVLLNYYYPTWEEANDELIAEVAENINDLQAASRDQLNHPLKPQLNKIVHKYTVYYTILRDVVEKDPREIYEDLHRDQKSFIRQIKKACAVRYKQAKTKLWRAATRSIIYIFLTKSIFVILLEVPAIRFFGEELNPFSLGVNVSFPALLLFAAVAFTKLPGEANTSKIVQGVEEIVFQEKRRNNPIILKKPPRRDAFVNAMFAIFYSATFILSFGVVIWALNQLHFSWVSVIIFLFFLAFASFFAIRIKRGAKYLVVVERKENIFTFLWNFFYVPIISTGKWLSTRFSKINVFVFIMDFIIEAPFKVFVRIAEDWSKYLKERRDDLS